MNRTEMTPSRQWWNDFKNHLKQFGTDPKAEVLDSLTPRATELYQMGANSKVAASTCHREYPLYCQANCTTMLSTAIVRECWSKYQKMQKAEQQAKENWHNTKIARITLLEELKKVNYLRGEHTPDEIDEAIGSSGYVKKGKYDLPIVMHLQSSPRPLLAGELIKALRVEEPGLEKQVIYNVLNRMCRDKLICRKDGLYSLPERFPTYVGSNGNGKEETDSLFASSTR
jgi:hypothetical protein